MYAHCACAPQHPSLDRLAAWLGPQAVRKRVGTFRNPAHNSRSIEIPRSDGHSRGTLPRRIPLENEQLLELINRTAHAAALSALVETENSYCFYFGVYVRPVGRFTAIYMALIDPFRKLVVYPLLLRTVRGKWNQAFRTTRTDMSA